jgi:hypothetical protein
MGRRISLAEAQRRRGAETQSGRQRRELMVDRAVDGEKRPTNRVSTVNLPGKQAALPEALSLRQRAAQLRRCIVGWKHALDA